MFGIFQDQQGSQSGWRKVDKVKSKMRLEGGGKGWSSTRIIQGLVGHGKGFHFYSK